MSTLEGYKLIFHVDGIGLISHRSRTILSGFAWARKKYPGKQAILKNCDRIKTGQHKKASKMYINEFRDEIIKLDNSIEAKFYIPLFKHNEDGFKITFFDKTREAINWIDHQRGIATHFEKKHNTMKKLTTLESLLKVFRIPRTQDDPEIEKLDSIITEWDGEGLQHLVDSIFDGFEVDLVNRKKMNAKIMDWFDQDTYDYLRLKVGQGYINEFGDKLTREKGYAVNIRAELMDVLAPGASTMCRFERLRDAKAWIDGQRKWICTWKLKE